MKGYPALRSALVLLLLAAVFYPVSRVISRGDHRERHLSPAITPSGKQSSLCGTLRIRTAPEPLRLEVTAGGKAVLGSKDSATPGDFTKEISVPSGSDLVLRAAWSDDHPHALHAEFLPAGTDAPVSRDYWSGRTLEDVLSLP